MADRPTRRPNGNRRGLRGIGHITLILACVLAALGAGDRARRYLIEEFVVGSGAEAVTTLELIDAFVNTYAVEREGLDVHAATVPASFRARALTRFAAERDAPSRIRVSMVGMPGREIVTKASDAELAAALDRLATAKEPTHETSVTAIEGRYWLRTILPSLANQTSCVDCHNRMQSAGAPWRFGAMMGALVVESPADEVVARASRNGVVIGVAVFLCLYGLGGGGVLLGLRLQRLRAGYEKTAQNRLGNAIENLSEAIAVFDRDDRLVVTNPAYRRIHALIADVLVPGVPFETILRENVRRSRFDLGEDERETYIARRLAQHRDPGDPIERRLADGRWERVREERLADGGLTLVITDVTRDKEREAFLRSAKEEAEAASRAKSLFLANMSHELRTPLNAIIGFSEIIERRMFGRDASDRYSAYAADIGSSGRHLLDVINDILDMSKIDAGRYELEERAVSIAAAGAACIRIISDQAAKGGVKLVDAIPKDLPPVQADQRALKQILLNLLANGVKFTPPGGSVTLAASRLSDGGLALSVADTGIGIAADQIAHVCEPFRQADGDLSRPYQGTGLGLSICRRLAELHGGELTIESTEKLGTTVTVSLPAHRLSASPAQAA